MPSARGSEPTMAGIRSSQPRRVGARSVMFRPLGECKFGQKSQMLASRRNSDMLGEAARKSRGDRLALKGNYMTNFAVRAVLLASLSPLALASPALAQQPQQAAQEAPIDAQD